MGKPNRNAYKNKLKWWYDFRRYAERILTRSAVPAAPVNLIQPFVTGATVAGSTLFANDGRWATSSAVAYTYQWRSNSVDIPGAVGGTLTTVDGVDEGKLISVRVTATNSSGATSATSLPLPALV